MNCDRMQRAIPVSYIDIQPANDIHLRWSCIDLSEHSLIPRIRESGAQGPVEQQSGAQGHAEGSATSACRDALPSLEEQAKEIINDNADWIDQSIVCMYFQSQQQSYMVNRYNRENPDAPVNIDGNGAWQEAPTHKADVSDDDPHEGLCEYEMARRTRIHENEVMLASLNIPTTSSI